MLAARSFLRNAAHKQQTIDCVVLDFDERSRRRLAITCVRGLEFLLDLPRPAYLRGGDVLILEDGRAVEIVSAPEKLMEISCTDKRHALRMAWHLGNRHLPTQISGEKLRIRADGVIAEMAQNLGARVREIEAPFDPEGGAYSSEELGAHSHAHGHEHSHRGDHDHGRSHAHSHGPTF